MTFKHYPFPSVGFQLDILSADGRQDTSGVIAPHIKRVTWVGPLMFHRHAEIRPSTRGIVAPALHQCSPEAPPVAIIERILFGEYHYCAVPLIDASDPAETWWMAGPRYVGGGDSRFDEICHYPIKLHERVEGTITLNPSHPQARKTYPIEEYRALVGFPRRVYLPA